MVVPTKMLDARTGKKNSNSAGSSERLPLVIRYAISTDSAIVCVTSPEVIEHLKEMIARKRPVFVCGADYRLRDWACLLESCFVLFVSFWRGLRFKDQLIRGRYIASCPALGGSTNEYSPEIIDVRASRPRRKQIAYCIKCGPGIMI